MGKLRPTAEGAEKRYSEKEMADILRDVNDPRRVTLVCGTHNYIGKELPPDSHGCKDCWQVWWMHKIASTPPHLRQQRMQEAFEMLTHANEEVEKGNFDFIADLKPTIQYEKDVN